jgi:hypothetical protein
MTDSEDLLELGSTRVHELAGLVQGQEEAVARA